MRCPLFSLSHNITITMPKIIKIILLLSDKSNYVTKVPFWVTKVQKK